MRAPGSRKSDAAGLLPPAGSSASAAPRRSGGRCGGFRRSGVRLPRRAFRQRGSAQAACGGGFGCRGGNVGGLRGGLGAAGAAADRLLGDGRFSGRCCGGSCGIGGRCVLLRPRPLASLSAKAGKGSGAATDFAGAGAACGRLGLGFGGRQLAAASAGRLPTGSSEPSAFGQGGSFSHGLCCRGGVTFGNAPCGGSGRPSSALPEPLLLRFASAASSVTRVLRYRLQPGHYPYVATLLPLTRRHIRHPLGQICVNTRRH